MTFLDTACLVQVDDTSRPCDLPLEVLDRHTLPSSHGPVEHLQVQCVRGHRYTHVDPLTVAAPAPAP